MIPAKLRNGLRLGYLLFRDFRHAPLWLRDRLWKQNILDLRVPWITWGAIDHLREIVHQGMKVFEWGGGGSTLFFLDRGCHVMTLETDAAWAEALKRRAGPAPGTELEWLTPSGTENWDPASYYSAVAKDAPWDLVLVDGPDPYSRMECIRSAIPCVKPGGFLVLDNADWPDFAGAPALLEGWERRMFRGSIPSARSMGQTDVYRKPPRSND